MGSEFLLLLLAAAPDAAALMAQIRDAPGFEARFVETKRIALLSAPLVTSGRMYLGPDRALARVVESPRRSRVVVEADRLTTVEGERVERLDLSGQPEAKALVGAVRALLAGDLPTLEVAFTVGFVAEDEAWTLTLTPRSDRLGALVRRLSFEGRGPAPVRFTVEEKSGDTTITELSEANPKREFTPDERRAIFGLVSG